MEIFKNLSLRRLPKGLLVVLACNAGCPLPHLEASYKADYPQESFPQYSSDESEYYDPALYSQSPPSTLLYEELEYYDPSKYSIEIAEASSEDDISDPQQTTQEDQNFSTLSNDPNSNPPATLFFEETEYYDPSKYSTSSLTEVAEANAEDFAAKPQEITPEDSDFTAFSNQLNPSTTLFFEESEYYDPSKYSRASITETTQANPEDFTSPPQQTSHEDQNSSTFATKPTPIPSIDPSNSISKENEATSYPFDGYFPVVAKEEALQPPSNPPQDSIEPPKEKIAEVKSIPKPAEPLKIPEPIEDKPSSLTEGKGNIKFVKKAPEINSGISTESNHDNDKASNVIGKQIIAEPAVGFIEESTNLNTQLADSEKDPSPSKPVRKEPLTPDPESPTNLIAQTQNSTIPQQPAATPPGTTTTPRPPTVITPTTPDPATGNRPQPAAANSPLKEISINFNNVSMIEYIRFISRISNKNFIFDDEDLQFNVTIVSEEPTSIQNLMAALLQELRVRDLSLIEQGNNIMIHRNPRVKSPGRIVAEGDVLITSRISELVTRVFRLNTLDPVKASEIIRPLLSEDALVEVLRDTNNIVVTDLVTNVNKITQLISTLDAPNSGVTIGQYVVRNGFVDTLVDLTTKILQPIAQGNPFVLVPHAASNSIFIVSNSFIVEKALAILQNLDLNEGRTKILSLEKLHPTNVPGYGGPGSGGGGPGGGGPGGRGGPGGFGQPGGVAPGGIGSAGYAPGVTPESYPGAVHPFGEGGLGIGGQYQPVPEGYPYAGFGSAGFNPANPESYAFGPGGIGTQARLTPQAPGYPSGGLGTEGQAGGQYPYGGPGYQGQAGIQEGGVATPGQGYYLPDGTFVPGGVGTGGQGYYLPDGTFVPGAVTTGGQGYYLPDGTFVPGGIGTQGGGYYLPNGEFVPGRIGTEGQAGFQQGRGGVGQTPGGGIAPGGIGTVAGGYYLPNGEFVPGRIGTAGEGGFQPGFAPGALGSQGEGGFDPASYPFRPGAIGSEGRPNIFDEGRDFLPGGISSASRWTRELPTGHIERTLFFIYKLRYRRGDQIEIALRKIGMSLQLTGTANADLISAINSSQWLESSNSLIFTGTALALEKIKELILEVDVPLRQVFIEMLILETDIADSLTYGVDWITKFGGGNTSGEQGFLGLETGLISAAETINTGIVPPIVPQATSLLDATIGAAGYTAAIIGTHLTHNGLHFSTIGALVKAIHNDSKTNILLNPKIITEDNNTAEIFVGGVDRYKTQSITNDLGLLVTNNFQFLDVGVSLRVTPLIGNNGIVTLDIIQESTSASPTANTGGNDQNVNLVGVLSKSRTVTKVHVPDGFFVVISGLIQDKEFRNENRVPCLGGIPILGGLCKQKTNQDLKSNLMLFIRPLIIDTDDDYEDVTKRQQDVFCEKSKFRRMWNYEIDEALDYFNVKPTDPDEIGCAGCNQ